MAGLGLCFFCVAARKIAGAAAGPCEIPAIRPAETLYQGTGICREHLVITPPPPGAAARAAGLIVPGG